MDPLITARVGVRYRDAVLAAGALHRSLGLTDDVNVNPSGGALASNPMMVAGLLRIIEASQRIMDGQADRAVAHATSGPALQQNLVAVLEGEK